MKTSTYILNQRCVTYILLVSFFLQSCDNSSNTPVTGEFIAKESTDNIQEHTKPIDIKPLVDQELNAEGGYLVTFHEEKGTLTADVRVDEIQKEPNYRGLPVEIEKGTDLVTLLHLNKKGQQRLIQIERVQNKQPRGILIFKGGLKGGMEDPHKYTEEKKQAKEEKKADYTSPDFNRTKQAHALIPRILRGTVYQKKHFFSLPTFNIDLALGALATGKIGEKSVTSELILEKFMDEAKQGNAQAQERLYTLLTKPFGKKSFIDNKKAARLLKTGLDGKKVWAYKVKATNAENIEEAKHYYLLAANLGDEDATTEFLQRANLDWIYDFNAVDQSQLPEIASQETQKALKLGFAPQLLDYYRYLSGLRFTDAANKLLFKAAEVGDISAQIQVAQSFCFGINGFELNKKEALYYFLKAAEQGDAESQYQAGVLFSEGFNGQNPDKEQALGLYLQAAEQGDSRALYNAGVLYYHGFNGQNPDKKIALAFYLLAAEKGHPKAIFDAAVLLHTGFDGQEPDKEKALALYIRQELSNDARALYSAGLLLLQGFEGQEPNKKEAFNLFSRAAAKGHLEALCNIGILYRQGLNGQNPDNEEALKYFLQSAEQGCAIAQFNAGVLLQELGQIEKALDYYLRAANKGVAQAKFNSGTLLQYRGDKQAALKLYFEAASQGLASAQFNYALLLKGEMDSNPKRLEEIQKYFYRAAEQGFLPAMVNLGLFYTEIPGATDDDLRQALFWFEQAKALGSKEAEEYFSHYQKYLAKDEVETAEAEQEFSQILKEAEIPIAEIKEIISVEPLSVSEEIEKISQPDNEKCFELPGIKEPLEVSEQPVCRNVKAMRKAARAIGLLRKNYHNEAVSKTQRQPLSLTNKSLWDRIHSLDQSVLSHNNLVKLFSDPFFRNEVVIEPTKSGIKLKAHNKGTNQHGATSSHRAHTDKPNPAFLRDIKDQILSVFSF